MKKQIRPIFVLLLTVLLTASLGCFALSSGTTAKLYGVYGNGMLFRQNSTAVFAGTAKAGSEITCTIADENGKTVSDGKATAGKKNTFSLSVNTPQGGYTEYTVRLFENGVPFAKLKNVVFGELWLAAGQSNMSIPLSLDADGSEMKQSGTSFSYWLRFLQTPGNPVYNGSDKNVPYSPQKDMTGCKWVKGSDPDVYNSSAVAFYFAERLQKTLDVPVGILQSSLGHSSLSAWLPREAVDSDEQVKSILKDHGDYIEKADWNEQQVDRLTAVSACYNKKIAPLTNFRLSGMIWYQGENEVMSGRAEGDYTEQFNLLQQSYSVLFGCEKVLPVVFTQLAAHGYADDFRLQRFNIELSFIQNALPGARALVSVSDIPLTYLKKRGSIHPIEKKQIGERMAFCAEGLVYQKHSTYSAATVEKVTVSGSEVLITLNNTGDGLLTDGKSLKGFAVCAEDGVYLPAEAEVISDNTISVHCESVTKPCSVSYSVTQYNGRSNLFAGTDGMRLPVSPFVTDPTYEAHWWKDNGWTDCETDTVWRTNKKGLAAFYGTWTADSASVSVSEDSAFSGDCGLRVLSGHKSFTVSPVLTDENDKLFFDVDQSLYGYRMLSFQVRNNGSADIRFDSLTIQNDGKAFLPVMAGSGNKTDVSRLKTGCVIPADGQWHTVTLDLTKLITEDGRLLDNTDAAELENVSGLCFAFSCEQEGMSFISLDDFHFSTAKKKSVSEMLHSYSLKISGFFKRIFHIG